MHDDIREKLEAVLPDDFSKLLLNGSMRVLADGENKIRANLFAAGIRELCTYVLHKLAPDEQVRACPWWPMEREKRAKAEPDATAEELDQPTRQQRATYAMQGGMTDDQINDFGVDAGDIHSDFLKSFRELNKRTHVRPGSLIEKTEEIDKFADSTLTALLDFLKVLEECRETIAEALIDSIQDATIEELTRETVGELDILSTHTYVDSTTVEETEIVAIDALHIHYSVKGEVEVTLNFGSGSDFSNGDGASLGDSFPFAMTMKAPVKNPKAFEEAVCNVDTSSFYQ